MSELRSKKNKAKAVKTKQKEIDRIIDEKVMGKIQRQKDYRETWLERMLKEAELGEMQRQVEKGPILMKWSGMTCTKEIMMCNFNIQMHKYKELVAGENYLRQALQNDGLTVKQITSILKNCKYIKDKKVLLDAEKRAEDSRPDKGVNYFG